MIHPKLSILTLFLFLFVCTRGLVAQHTQCFVNVPNYGYLQIDGEKEANLMSPFEVNKIKPRLKSGKHRFAFYLGKESQYQIYKGEIEIKGKKDTINIPLPPPTDFDYGKLTDLRDQQEYKTIKIGNQNWMAENLNFDLGEGCQCPGKTPTAENCETYGRLYSWSAAQKSCPEGWHLPSDDEWKELEMYLGMSEKQANELGMRGTGVVGWKLSARTSWNETGGGDEVGFGVLAAGATGNRSYTLGQAAYFWTSTISKDNYELPYFRQITSHSVYRQRYWQGDRHSVRCVQDTER